MHINKTNNINFTAIYRVPLTTQSADEVIKYIIPAYKTVTHKHADFFVGENPYRIITDKLILNLAKNSGGSPKWLKDNAELHNIDTKHFIDDALHVITTKQDIQSVFNYITSKEQEVNDFLYPRNKKNTFSNRIKKLFDTYTPADNSDNDLPKHLQILKKILDFTKKNNEDFHKFAKDKIIKLDSTEELIEKLSKECV